MPNAARDSRSSLVADVEAARAALERAERALADHDRPTVMHNGCRYRRNEDGTLIEYERHDRSWGGYCTTASLRALARLIGTPAVINRDGMVLTADADMQAARDCYGPVREAVVVEVETP
jgi:hypothetical protein